MLSVIAGPHATQGGPLDIPPTAGHQVPGLGRGEGHRPDSANSTLGEATVGVNQILVGGNLAFVLRVPILVARLSDRARI